VFYETEKKSGGLVRNFWKEVDGIIPSACHNKETKL
jgi:hypothetical protein